MIPVALVVSIALAILAALARRSSHISEPGAEVFTFPGVLVWFMALCSSLIAFAPLWIPFIKPEMPAPKIQDYFSFGAFGGLGMLFTAYLYRYRVTIRAEVFAVGAFFKRQYRLVDIREAKLQKGQRSSEYFVYLRSGKRLRFSGLLSDFNTLTALLRPANEP